MSNPNHDTPSGDDPQFREAVLEPYRKLAILGRLAAGLTHEFNNLLAVMISNADLVLRSKNLDSRDRRRLQNMREAGEQAARMIRQIARFGRKSPPEKPEVDLVEIVSDAVEMLARTLPRGTDIHFQAQDARFKARINISEIQQVVIECGFNSRDALPQGGEITVRVNRANNDALIEIEDNSEGIPHRFLPRVYEAFGKVKNTPNGLGLGLSRARKIVDQHGGRMEIDSEPGRGTKVTITLPLVTGASEET